MGVFDEISEFGEPLCSNCAVYGPVICTKCDLHKAFGNPATNEKEAVSYSKLKVLRHERQFNDDESQSSS